MVLEVVPASDKYIQKKRFRRPPNIPLDQSEESEKLSPPALSFLPSSRWFSCPSFNSSAESASANASKMDLKSFTGDSYLRLYASLVTFSYRGCNSYLTRGSDDVDFSRDKETVILIIQYLQEHNFKNLAHKLEQETGLFLDLDYVEELVQNGFWEEADKYLFGFTKIEENTYSRKMFFKIRKQKYLEALDRKDSIQAVKILNMDLKVFEAIMSDVFNELCHLQSFNNIREHKDFSNHGDTQSGRVKTFNVIKKLILNNPLLCGRLEFPCKTDRRLEVLIEQSLKYQYFACSSRDRNLQFKSLFVDHSCDKVSSSTSHDLKELNAAPASVYQERSKNVAASRLPHSLGTVLRVVHHRADKFPRSLVRTLSHHAGDTTSMDFNPVMPTLLLIGTNVGDVELWDISKRERIAFRNSNIKDSRSSKSFMVSNDFNISVNRVMWSPDGVHCGVAYSQNLVHVYNCNGGNGLLHHLEIDAHVGSVNDLSFSFRSEKVFIVTCGDDKAVKVWEVSTGRLIKVFELEAPVFSICPYRKYETDYIISTFKDGKVKVCFYDDERRIPSIFGIQGIRKVFFDAPGNCSTRMAYSNNRLFSCGTTEKGYIHLAEWNDNMGSAITAYESLLKSACGVVHFNTFLDKYLAAGYESQIKIRDMDQKSILTTIRTNGLPATPYFQFNKTASLLAVTSNLGDVHILATKEGKQLLQVVDTNTGEDMSHVDIPSEPSVDLRKTVNKAPTPERIRGAPEFTKQSQCRCIRLVDELTRNCQISRLTYSHLGGSILALASNGTHSFWKWKENHSNSAANVTTTEFPRMYRPTRGEVMINELNSGNNESHVSCLDLTKSGFLISLSGGEVSFFNTVTFKKEIPIGSQSSTATVVAFHPLHGTIIAVGMEDSSIHLYSLYQQASMLLQGHQRGVTGLAFSKAAADILLSSGADAKLCIWKSGQSEVKNSMFLKIPSEQLSLLSGVHVQFHPRQSQFLAVHETMLAVYTAPDLQYVSQWMPAKLSTRITSATFSCDGLSVYASFGDGTVGVLNYICDMLAPMAWIRPNAYISENNLRVYPNAVAAHPSKPDQFALGMTDGSVYVLELLELELSWGSCPPPEDNLVSFVVEEVELTQK